MNFNLVLQSNIPALESLDALILVAERFAGRAMRTFGFVPPTLIALGPNGVLFFSPENLAEDSTKDRFAQIAHLICIAHVATAAVLILESWMAPIGSDVSGNSSVPPSESPHRREVVVLSGESRSGSKQTILSIVRARDGRFREFGEGEVIPTDHVLGRFARLLPTIPPTRAQQERVSLVLAGMGISLSTADSRSFCN